MTIKDIDNIIAENSNVDDLTPKQKENYELLSEKLLRARNNGQLSDEEIEHYNNTHINSRINPVTKKKFDYWEEVYRNSPDPETRVGAINTELRFLHNQKVYKNDKDGKFYNGYGYEVTNKDTIKKALSTRIKIRQEASKIIKDNEELNKFMVARDFDEYEAKQLKRFPSYAKIIDRLEGKDKHIPKQTIEDLTKIKTVEPDPLEDLIRSKIKQPEPTIPLLDEYKPTPNPDLTSGIGRLWRRR